MKQKKGKTMLLQRKPKSKSKSRGKTKIKLASNSRFSLRRMLPFLLVFAIVGTIMLWRSFAAESLTDIKLAEPGGQYWLQQNSDHRMAEYGELSGILLSEAFTNRTVMYFRHSTTGASTYLELPKDSLQGYGEVRLLMSSPNDLWVYGSSPSMYLRHYRLSGSPLPTSAQLVATKTFGNSDSRMGAIALLKSGAVTIAWHQQGDNGQPQGIFVAYRSASGNWQNLPVLNMTSTQAGEEAMAQHPADDSVWLFSNPDAWGSIGAARYRESSNGLTLDWSDGAYIRYHEGGLYDGIYGPHGENPSMAVAPDPYTGTLALAYQSDEEKGFTVPDGVLRAGALPVVARIAADKTKSFIQLPVYVERVAELGLIVRPGETWLSYWPLNEATGLSDRVHVSKYVNGAWENPIALGPTNKVYSYGYSRPEFSYPVKDDGVHFYTFLPTQSDTSPPAAPGNLTASLSSPTQALLSWQAATDNVGVVSYDIYRNNTKLASVVGTATQYTDSNLAAGTSYSYYVKGLDGAGNVSPASNSVTVTTTAPSPPTSTDTVAPAVSITSPANNLTIGRKVKSVAVHASATDNVGVTKMEVYIDGSLRSTTSSGTISYTWDVSRLSKGQHTIQVKAYDTRGNVGTAQVVVKK